LLPCSYIKYWEPRLKISKNKNVLSPFFQVWLREQILHGGGPEWLDMDLDNLAGNGAGGGAVPPVAAGGVGGFLFGGAGIGKRFGFFVPDPEHPT
jgi:hypothetical protein